MGIRESLKNAEYEYSRFINLGQAVTLLAKQNQVTEKEAARWLLLHNAHEYLTTYHLEPYIPIAREKEKENKIETILKSYIFKSTSPTYLLKITTIIGINLDNNPQNWNCGVNLDALNLFISKIGLPNLIKETTQVIEFVTAPTLTKPEQREIALLEYLKNDDGYADIMKLPITAKKQALDYLTENQPQLFTKSTFDKTWSSLNAKSFISIIDKKKYSPS